MATYMYGNVRYSKYIMEFHRCKFYLGIIQYPRGRYIYKRCRDSYVPRGA